jgi:phosphinothricin acetyltransferase
MDFKIEAMKPSDWEQVREIYLKGIQTGIATFQTVSDLPDWETWNRGHLPCCRLVASAEPGILGWAALSPTSSRPVYSGVVEVSIYIHPDVQGQGIGTALLRRLIKVSEENGFWTLQSGIMRENAASLALHQKCGFREVGIREKIGKMGDGTWHDVVLMERRSPLVR